ncbi:MAG: site-specific integrase [Actinomycetota bacterium]
MAAARSRRAPGAGHLFVKRDSAGRESWYGKWYAEGRQLMRKIGPKRGPNGHGLDHREAERKLRQLMEQVAPPPESRVSVQEAGERLIAHLEALGRKPATTEAYDSLLRVHLAPFFAGRSLDAISPDDLEAFIRAKAAEGKSAKTTRNALGFLHSIYEFGQRKGWAKGNPCKLIDKPRDDGEADIRFLDTEELDAVVRVETGDELAPTLALVYRTAVMTGLRQGELIALRWQDVDWPAGRIRVRRSYVRGEFSSPKSRRGSRSVPLADELAGELERHYQASAWQADADLVFPHPRLGGPLDRSKVRKRFKAAVKSAGVREVRFHDLRHTFGTRMAGAGVPMRTLQEWMGHRDFKTTLIYADYSPSVHEREWVEAAFARATTGATKLSEPERTEVASAHPAEHG